MRADTGREERAGASRGRGRAALVAILSGALLGGVNSAANVWGSPYTEYSLSPDGVFPLEVLAAMLGTLWAWALAAFGIGWYTRRPRRAALLATAGLIVAVVVYYGSDAAFGLDSSFSWYEALVWSVLSVVAGCVFGPLGAWGARREWWSILPALTAPVGVALFGTTGGSDKIQPWPTVMTWVVAAVLCIAVLVRWARLMLRRRAE